MSTTMTRWVNTITGERLDRATLDAMQAKAQTFCEANTFYEANTHIFEDEFEALTALGAVPMFLLEPVAA